MDSRYRRRRASDRSIIPVRRIDSSGCPGRSLKTNQTLPKSLHCAGAQWCSESQEVTASQLTLASLNETPRRLSALVEVSKQLLTQAPELAEPMIERNVRQAIGYAVDVGCLSGVGGLEPIGLLNADGIAEPVTFGGAAALLDACAFEKEIGDNFAEQGPLSFIGSVATREKWRQIQKWSGSSTPLWDDDNEIIGHPAIATPAISNTDSRMVFGCFSLFQIVMFGEVDITRDNLTGAKQGIVKFIFHLFCDAVALQSEAFARSTDAANQA